MPGTVVVNQPGVLAVDSEGNIITESVVFFEFLKIVPDTGPTYFVGVDLSNSSGDYKHTETGGINLLRASSFLEKDTSNASWIANVGVITAIDGTSATISFLAQLGNSTDKTTSFLATNTIDNFPLTFPLKVVTGAFEKIITNNNVITTDINTGSSLEDLGGNLIAPAVGDLILRIERTTGSGLAKYGVSGAYYTVA